VYFLYDLIIVNFVFFSFRNKNIFGLCMLSYADSLLMKVDEVQLQFGDEKLKLMS